MLSVAAPANRLARRNVHVTCARSSAPHFLVDGVLARYSPGKLTNDGPRVWVTHSFDGDRFQQHTMPVEVLSELIAYKQLVIAVARDIFFERHPTRMRAPKGFDERFQLELARIGKGSARNALVRPLDEADGTLQLRLIERDEFDEARDRIQDAISGTAQVAFTAKSISMFNNFGRSLRDDESISIDVHGSGRGPVKYNREVRKRIVLERAQTYENDNAETTGRVVQYDPEAPHFVVRVSDGRRVTCRLDPESPDLPDIKKVVGSAVATPELLIRVRGRGAFDSRDVLTKFVRIDDVTYAEDEALRDQLDIEKRLSVLAELEAGWWDGEGEEISQVVLDRVSSFLAEAVGQDDPLPRIFPTMEGSILAEWSFPDAVVSAEFDHDDGCVHVCGVQIRSRASRTVIVQTPAELMAVVLSFGPPGMVASS